MGRAQEPLPGAPGLDFELRDSAALSARRPHLLPHNPPQCVLQLGRFAFYMFTQRLINQSLVSRCSARRIGLFQEMIHQIFIQSNGDARLAARLRLRGRNPAPLALAEIIFPFHRESFYGLCSWVPRGGGQEHRSGLKPSIQYGAFAARLKTCPFKTSISPEVPYRRA